VNAGEQLLLVSVGTDYHAFDRLVSWLDRWLAAEAPADVRCVVQYGTSQPPARAEGHQYLDHEKLQALMAEATVIICHGGPATITGARQSGHKPIVVPRDSSRGEHVDNHQRRFARRLAREGLIACCETEGEFRATLQRALAVPQEFRVATAHEVAIGQAEVSAAVDRLSGLVDELVRQSGRMVRRPKGAAGPALEDPGAWPKVTVVVPTRNRPDFLRKAVDCVMRQDYPGEIECLVVFDGTDPDLALVLPGAARSVSVTTNHRTPGLAGARNSGILESDGELVAFCDDDDSWLPGKLRRQVRTLVASPEASLVACGIRVEYDGRSVDRLLGADWVTHQDLLRSRLTELHPSTFLMRREAVLHEFGLVDEHVPGSYGEDYEFLLRASKHGPIANVPEVLVEVLWHKRSYFSNRWQTISTALTWLLERYPEFEAQPRGHARVAGQVAFAEAAQGNRRAALYWAARTLRSNPVEPRAYLALMVATGAVQAAAVVRQLHSRGRGL